MTSMYKLCSFVSHFNLQFFKAIFPTESCTERRQLFQDCLVEAKRRAAKDQLYTGLVREFPLNGALKFA